MGELETPVDDRLRTYASELVSKLLALEWRKRPSATEVRHLLKNLSEKQDEIIIVSTELPGTCQIWDGRSRDKMTWKSLKWKRYWYLLSFPSEIDFVSANGATRTWHQFKLQLVPHLRVLLSSSKVATATGLTSRGKGNGHFLCPKIRLIAKRMRNSRWTQSRSLVGVTNEKSI